MYVTRMLIKSVWRWRYKIPLNTVSYVTPNIIGSYGTVFATCSIRWENLRVDGGNLWQRRHVQTEDRLGKLYSDCDDAEMWVTESRCGWEGARSYTPGDRAQRIRGRGPPISRATVRTAEGAAPPSPFRVRRRPRCPPRIRRSGWDNLPATYRPMPAGPHPPVSPPRAHRSVTGKDERARRDSWARGGEIDGVCAGAGAVHTEDSQGSMAAREGKRGKGRRRGRYPLRPRLPRCSSVYRVRHRNSSTSTLLEKGRQEDSSE
jgi:hypothetical protein